MNGVEAFLSERIGLRVDGAARGRLERAARQAAGRAGCSEAELARLLNADPARAQELIDRVTVQESGFFRHPEQFEFLAGHLRGLDAPGVIWSAGCGNGQEPWSLAMLLEEQGLDGWSVLASDVSATALQRARDGAYAERELRGLSELRCRRFVHDGAVNPRLRARVRFLHHNLAAALPPADAGDCRVVLCRNVLIYLHRPAIDRWLAGLRRRMPAGALLVTGAGEASGPLEGFRPGAVPGVLVRAPDRPAAAAPAAGEAERPLPSVQWLLGEGGRLAESGDLEGAAACFRRAGYLEPDDPRARARLAAVLDRIAQGG